PYRGV
ncbi:CO dehydrogenase maturation factor, partial [Candidatus Hakubella thermalkaliphila]